MIDDLTIYDLTIYDFQKRRQRYEEFLDCANKSEDFYECLYNNDEKNVCAGGFLRIHSNLLVLFSEDGPVMVVLVNRGISPSFSIPLRYQYVGSEAGVLMFQSMQVAVHKRSIFAAKVHTVAFTERKDFAIFTRLRLFHPCTVAVGFEAVFPYVPERVFVNVPLIELAAYRCAGRNRAVNQNRGDADSSSTLVEMVANTSFVVS